MSALGECMRCARRWRWGELREVRDLAGRVYPRGRTLVGECPSCGALCLEADDSDADRGALREGRIEDLLRELSERINAMTPEEREAFEKELTEVMAADRTP